ncbi:MAG: 4-(cytidine 5'-diphospho)-2-C-methyl-D-erythritol kinase [Clostridiales Family XIII bacterium]|jgi:4-diphosphocytidyl-2-C-methyl-D-erythritol kinase|nr:4-(cytidine 5'-diphospho)-2-C-methyl-D-erythritol kinase [Clostridiales Family XIII bacterium]
MRQNDSITDTALRRGFKNSSTVEIKSYAKINLSIDILGKLPNGYHSIRTVMQQVDLFDIVRVSVRPGGADARVLLSADAPVFCGEVFPTGEDNIAVRAANVFIETFAPQFCGSVAIHLRKKIPLAAGLAGGSGNAAAVILALFHILTRRGAAFGSESPSACTKRLMELGSRIGADVPFCIMGQAALNRELGLFSDSVSSCALAEGVGEKLTPLPSPRGYALIVKPAVSVSTAAVYGGFDPDAILKRPDTDELAAALGAGDRRKIRKNMINVLEISVIEEYPEIADIKETLAADSAAECALMSGSGSSVFAWYSDRSACETLFRTFPRTGNTCVYMAELL